MADVGCGAGVALIAMAQRFPRSHFHGYDISRHAIERATELVAEAGLDNVELHLAGVDALPGEPTFDLVLTFDCLHDMTDPRRPSPPSAGRSTRTAPGWSRTSGARPTRDNLKNPMAAMMYGFSIASCMSSAMSEPGGAGLGTLGLHPDLLAELVADGGLHPLPGARFRRAGQPLLRGAPLSRGGSHPTDPDGRGGTGCSGAERRYLRSGSGVARQVGDDGSQLGDAAVAVGRPRPGPDPRTRVARRSQLANRSCGSRRQRRSRRSLSKLSLQLAHRGQCALGVLRVGSRPGRRRCGRAGDHRWRPSSADSATARWCSSTSDGSERSVCRRVQIRSRSSPQHPIVGLRSGPGDGPGSDRVSGADRLRAAVSFAAAPLASSANAGSGMSSRGSTALMRVPPSAPGSSTTLQGRTSAELGSSSRAWLAKVGLQAPRIFSGGPVDAELGLEGGGDVDLGEDTEAVVGERGPHGRFGLVEGKGDGGFDGVHGSAFVGGSPGGRVRRGA